MGTECESEKRNARGTVMGLEATLEKEDYYFRGFTKAAWPGSQGGRRGRAEGAGPDIEHDSRQKGYWLSQPPLSRGD